MVGSGTDRGGFPNRLRFERHLRGWSQAELAERLGTTTLNISRWENGTFMPRMYFRRQMAQIFGKAPEELGLPPFVTDDPNESGAQLPALDPHASSYPPSSLRHEFSFPPNLTDPARLIGRESLLAQLKEQLLGGGARIALQGAPGIGKTALALALIHDPAVQRRYPDGVLWAGLGQHSTVFGWLGAWASRLDFGERELAGMNQIQLRSHAVMGALESRRMLLVVDDVPDPRSGLAFAVAGPNCGYLATTRMPATASYLGGEGFTTLHELTMEESIAVLESFVPGLLEISPDDTRAIAAASGGLPLSLSLMGRYLRAQSVHHQTTRIQRALALLRSTTERLKLELPIQPTAAAAGQRQAALLSLKEVYDMSVRQLETPVRQALRALSVFPPKPSTFSEEAALAVIAADPGSLDALVDVGLIEVAGAGRYAIQRSIWDYARHTTTDALPSVRLVEFFVPLLEEHAGDYTALDDETANLFAALAEAYVRGMHKQLIRGALSIAPYLAARGLTADALTHLRHAHESALQVRDYPALARLAMYLGRIAELQGNLRESDQLYGEGLQAARTAGDQEAASAVLACWSETIVNYDDYERAEQYIQEGLSLARALDRPARIGVLLRLLGEVADSKGEYERGTALYKEGLTCSQQVGDWENVSALLQNLGVKAERQGQYDEAERYYAEGLKVAYKIEHRQRISALLMNRGVLAQRRGNLLDADALYQQSLKFAQLTGNRLRIGSIEQNLGVVASLQGRFDEAERHLTEALKQARAIGHRWLVAETLVEHGEHWLRRGQPDLAAAQLTEALTEAEQHHASELVAAARFGLARALMRQGRAGEALPLAQRSADIYRAMGHQRAHEVTAWLREQTPHGSGSAQAISRSATSHSSGGSSQ